MLHMPRQMVLANGKLLVADGSPSVLHIPSYLHLYRNIYICIYIYIYRSDRFDAAHAEAHGPCQRQTARRRRLAIGSTCDDKYTPTNHLTPPPLFTTAAVPQRLTPTRRHHYNKRKGTARRRTAPTPTDVAHNWAIHLSIYRLIYVSLYLCFYSKYTCRVR